MEKSRWAPRVLRKRVEPTEQSQPDKAEVSDRPVGACRGGVLSAAEDGWARRRAVVLTELYVCRHPAARQDEQRIASPMDARVMHPQL